uniref:Poly(A) polymerase alpha n=2 Tax=Erpetoichthys calabaricus TaxID=27687 RepID=A0A8C4XEI5_ERPCA
MWVIGIVFKKMESSENLNVDLTYDIQSFTDTVYRQAINSKMFEQDMKITAMHVKRKQLHQLLPNLVIQKKRKHSTESIRLANENSLDLSLDSDNSMSVPSPTAVLKSISQIRSSSPQGLSPTTSATNSQTHDTPSKTDLAVVSGGLSGENVPVKSPGNSVSPKPNLIRVVSSTRVINQTPRPAGNAAVKPSVKRPASPNLEEAPKRLKGPEDASENVAVPDGDGVLSDVKMAVDKEDGEIISPAVNSGESEKISDDSIKRAPSNDLSDVPILPSNPIPVVKNSIKLRLSR